jgi:hypothetical protein
MRTVRIVEDKTSQRPWIAVDHQTGAPLLRLQDRGQLEYMCWRLGWDVVDLKLELRRRVRSA